MKENNSIDIFLKSMYIKKIKNKNSRKQGCCVSVSKFICYLNHEIPIVVYGIECCFLD